MDWKQLLKSWVLIALGVLLASYTSMGGIQYDSVGALIIAVVLLSFLNVFLKPVLMLFSLPFIILTFGIGIWLINALLFLFVGWVVGGSDGGFVVNSFGSALWGALVVSITSFIANVAFASKGRGGVNVQIHRGGPTPGNRPSPSAPKRRSELDDDDVIDI
ncbi:phage holin family protein [Coraliomargarita parva]|uniref:phage holin family protein n=1 Tax=Coraliomargarita parva TaxID=3014050 RepID=UPI0022B2E016|nr:phage holin family protein [Coraliomargarita parva]